MAKVDVFTITFCPYCVSAKQLLNRKGVAYEEHDLSDLPDEELHRQMIALSGKRTVPQIVINGRAIGGYDDLRRLDQAGELDTLLSE